MTTKKTTITLDEQLLQRLDEAKGPVNRSAFIAGILHRQLNAEHIL